MPALGGKTDMIPGRVTTLSLTATRPGTYRGPCSEFCGTSHALMAVSMVATEKQEFQGWTQQRAAQPPLSENDGSAVFARYGCPACHAIDGTQATGRIGPDLTGLGARQAIGAGALANTDRQYRPLHPRSAFNQTRHQDARLPDDTRDRPSSHRGLSEMAVMGDALTIEAAVNHQTEEAQLREVWSNPTGWRYWTSVNNTQIGLWYGSAAFIFMLFAGVLALLVRLQLAVPDNDFLSADFFNQAFTLHGTVMMFLFAVPIFEAVAIFLLPPMLGARELPFPRLTAFGFWSFALDGVFVCGSIFFDAAPNTGWFMYPPLATDPEYAGIGADIWLLGLSFIEVASIAAAVELIVGVMKCRAPGMRVNLMPLFAWYLLIVAGMILFAFPPLIAGDILFEMQRMFDWPFFDAARGGDALLWQHLFWIFGHPDLHQRWITPLSASLVELVVVWIWHAPGVRAWSDASLWAGLLEQASFLAGGLLLWLVCLRRETVGGRLAGAGGLLLTSMHMTLLGVLLTMAPRPLFGTEAVTCLGLVLSPEHDQQLGGVIMLMVGAAAYIIGGVALLAGVVGERLPRKGGT